MGSGPRGRERVDGGVGTGKLPGWSELEIELFGDRRQPYRAAATLL